MFFLGSCFLGNSERPPTNQSFQLVIATPDPATADWFRKRKRKRQTERERGSSIVFVKFFGPEGDGLSEIRHCRTSVRSTFLSNHY